jgi:hypothetical protein
MNRNNLTLALVCAEISFIFQSGTARAEDAGDDSQQPTATVVVHATAIPGSTIDADKFPGDVEVLSSADLTREGSASLTGALNSQRPQSHGRECLAEKDHQGCRRC